ncbi:MAG: hypothetical protein LBP59_08420 [Planctomycetaceae bacterium]|nr:hypothetical protein [Planctomycetaceae bacterium]
MLPLRDVIQIVLEIQRFKSVKTCRPKARQAKVNENSSANSLNIGCITKIVRRIADVSPACG